MDCPKYLWLAGMCARGTKEALKIPSNMGGAESLFNAINLNKDY